MGEAFKKMGGQILTGLEVEQIVIKEKKAIGVKLKDGQEMTGKTLISNIDAHSTFTDLIGERQIPSGFRSRLKGMKPSISYFILYLGVDGGLDELSVSNNEVFFENDLQKEYESLSKNQISEEAPFYLLAPSIHPMHPEERAPSA